MAVQRLTAELRPDVVLLDLVMPDLRPVEFAQWVRAYYPGTEVLPLTVHDRDCYLAGMVEAGAAGCLLKAEAPETIVAAVRAAVRGRGTSARRWRPRWRPGRGGSGQGG